jgi:hypothetical protein
VVAGSILVPLGVVLILISWYGSAHTAYVQQQIPYLVSGSFAGLGCMVLGGLFYWAHWLYRLYDQADQHHEEQLAVMQQTLRVMVERVHGGSGNGWAPAPGDSGHEVASAGGAMHPLATGPRRAGVTTAAPGVAPSQPLPVTGGPGPVGATYVVTAAGSAYHLPGCPIIAHHSEGLRVLGAGAAAGLEPCRICLPGQPL